jgi:hypothetical protein
MNPQEKQTDWREMLKKIAPPGMVPNQFILEDFIRSFAFTLLDETGLEPIVCPHHPVPPYEPFCTLCAQRDERDQHNRLIEKQKQRL